MQPLSITTMSMSENNHSSFKETSSPTLSKVSDKVQLQDCLRKNLDQIHKVPMIPMNCSFGVVTMKTESVQPLQKAVKNMCRKDVADVAIIFAVRRPGCGYCREHGLQLSELAKEEDLAMMGVVKGNSIVDENLLEFYSGYFRFPLYSDETWSLYRLMGDRRLSVGKVLKGLLSSAGKRLSKKNIVNRVSTKEDGLTEGGLLILDARGTVRYCYNENFGKELDVELLREAIRAIREGGDSN
jgi:thiol-disulfide isomerase/thioredoxin